MKTVYQDNKILVSNLRKGQEEAYNYVIDSYHQPLCVYALNLTRDLEKAQDIVQNVYVKLWEKRLDLNPELPIKSLLYKSVYNEFIDQYRKTQAILSTEKKYLEALNSLVEEIDTETFQRLIAAVKKGIEDLPPRCREIFIFSKENGLTNKEIAEHLNISVKTVETQITKAFSILRQNLGEKIEMFLFLLYGHSKFSTLRN